MQKTETHEELRAIFRARVDDSFDRARECIEFARLARWDGDRRLTAQWVGFALTLRRAAARWRQKAIHIAPFVLCALWLAGCGQSQREFDVGFDVQPGDDGESVTWMLHFNRAQYHAMLDETTDGAEASKI